MPLTVVTPESYKVRGVPDTMEALPRAVIPVRCLRLWGHVVVANGSQKTDTLVRVVGMFHLSHDVDDRLRCQTGNHHATDVFDGQYLAPSNLDNAVSLLYLQDRPPVFVKVFF